jgi:Tol biopolymer transport system component
MKKLFIISSALLIMILLFWVIYNFAFKKDSPEMIGESSTKEEPKTSADTASSPKNKTEGKIQALTDEAILAPTLSKDEEHIKYYTRYNGNVYEITVEGADKKTVSSIALFDLENVFWSPDKEKVISKFYKDGKTTFYTYAYDTKSEKKLADGVDSVSWSNLGDRIIYKYFDSRKNKGNISIADPDGGNWQNLAGVPWRYVSLAPVPQTSLVSFWNEPDSFSETALETVGVAGGKTKKIFSGRFGADYLWAPDGSRILISSSDSKGSSKMTLAVANSNGGEYQNLNIPTLTSKCVWSENNKTVYYALPGSIPDGSVMPNDYQAKKITTQDTFWKVDVETGKQERLIELEEIGESNKTFDAGDLFLSPDEDILFFVNRADGKLYRIDL